MRRILVKKNCQLSINLEESVKTLQCSKFRLFRLVLSCRDAHDVALGGKGLGRIPFCYLWKSYKINVHTRFMRSISFFQSSPYVIGLICSYKAKEKISIIHKICAVVEILIDISQPAR